jgi:hypothetical protein
MLPKEKAVAADEINRAYLCELDIDENTRPIDVAAAISTELSWADLSETDVAVLHARTALAYLMRYAEPAGVLSGAERIMEQWAPFYPRLQGIGEASSTMLAALKEADVFPYHDLTARFTYIASLVVTALVDARKSEDALVKAEEYRERG